VKKGEPIRQAHNVVSLIGRKTFPSTPFVRMKPLSIRSEDRIANPGLYLEVQSVGRSRVGTRIYSRKVRAPVNRLPGNTWAWVTRVVRDGKCHREETAIFREGKGETVG
jgi:hypothetical protein